MLSHVSATSLYVAAARAYESEYQHPLFSDPYARSLSGQKGFELFSELRQFSPRCWINEPHPGISIRTRFFDDTLLSAVHELSLQQVVLIGAGMDVRAFRFPWMKDIKLFEVDRQEIFQYKEPILLSLEAEASCVRHLVQVDLQEDWGTALLQSGFNFHVPTAFLIEGVLFYLKPAIVATVLDVLRELACPGSWLGMDAIAIELLDSPHAQPFLSKLKQLGCPWQFGVVNPEQFLLDYGWQPKIVILGEPEANYCRWPYPASNTISTEFNYYLITARRLGP